MRGQGSHPWYSDNDGCAADMSGELRAVSGSEEKCVRVPGSLATPEHLSRPGGATRSDLYSYNHTAHREEARKTF